MKQQKTASKYEGYWAHRTNISEAVEFLADALQEAENQIDIVRHIKKKQDV